jgi:two-component system, LytTR family, response regulator LytT
VTALRALVVDDEPPAVDELCFLLRNDDDVMVTATAGSATEALRVLDHGDVDVVFLDIDLPDLDGLSVARFLTRLAKPPAIVFVTASEHHGIAAFDVRAVDYLLKPLRADRVTESLRRVRAALGMLASGEQRAEPRTRLPAESGGRTVFVERDDVLVVEAARDYVRLHTADRSHLVRVPISVLESEWSEVGFVRVHRGFLLALRSVQEIRSSGGQTVVAVVGVAGQPATWREVPVSRTHARELRERLIQRSTQGRR